MNLFVKALDKIEFFLVFKWTFFTFTGGKIKEVVFVGLDKRRLINDKNSEKIMKSFAKDAWISFEDVTQQFLGNYNDNKYARIVEEIFGRFQKLD